MKYRWSHAVCRTDFSRNQLLCPKHWRRFLFLETFDHELGNEIDQVSRMLFSEHANTWDAKTNICRFCSLITQISVFVIPKVCLSKCVFHLLTDLLNLMLEYLFEEIYDWVRAHFSEHRLVSNRASSENRSKGSLKGSLKHSFSVKAYCIPLILKYNFWRLEYLFWRPKRKLWGQLSPNIFFWKSSTPSGEFNYLKHVCTRNQPRALREKVARPCTKSPVTGCNNI